jgi:hypothetical protein
MACQFIESKPTSIWGLSAREEEGLRIPSQHQDEITGLKAGICLHVIATKAESPRKEEPSWTGCAISGNQMQMCNCKLVNVNWSKGLTSTSGTNDNVHRANVRRPMRCHSKTSNKQDKNVGLGADLASNLWAATSVVLFYSNICSS